jgi:hypothetical protein
LREVDERLSRQCMLFILPQLLEQSVPRDIRGQIRKSNRGN